MHAASCRDVLPARLRQTVAWRVEHPKLQTGMQCTVPCGHRNNRAHSHIHSGTPSIDRDPPCKSFPQPIRGTQCNMCRHAGQG